MLALALGLLGAPGAAADGAPSETSQAEDPGFASSTLGPEPPGSGCKPTCDQAGL